MAQSWCGKHKNKEDRKIENLQFVCDKCNTPFKYDWHVGYSNCPKCGNDVAKQCASNPHKNLSS